jgi:hypothetical protein
MLAVGCLIPVVLAVGGTVGGAVLAGQQGSIWGGIAGLALGIVVPAAMLVALAGRKKR